MARSPTLLLAGVLLLTTLPLAHATVTPSLAVTASGLDATADASGSTSDGAIVSYDLDFGDGSPVVSGADAISYHTYAADGTYLVVVTIADDLGDVQTASQEITVATPPPANEAPQADLSVLVHKLDVAVDGTLSFDVDGSVVAYAFDFGDGSPVETTATATHSYAAAGTYTIALTVTDDQGATGGTTADVIAVANVAPTADFTTLVHKLDVTVDGTGSSDVDGSVVGYAFDFGDGSPVATTVTASHTYAASGTYSISLTTTDDDGATDTLASDVIVAANVAPAASISATIAGMKVSAVATASDADGSVVNYTWSFGEGPLAYGAAKSHTYTTPGTKTITLTVKDDDGATTVVTKTVTLLRLTVTELRYDLLPLGTTGRGAHYYVAMKVEGAPVKDLSVVVAQAGTGAGSVGASKTFHGTLPANVYSFDLYVDGPGAATQVCASALGTTTAGVHVETADGVCTGIDTVLGTPVSLA